MGWVGGAFQIRGKHYDHYVCLGLFFCHDVQQAEAAAKFACVAVFVWDSGHLESGPCLPQRALNRLRNRAAMRR